MCIEATVTSTVVAQLRPSRADIIKALVCFYETHNFVEELVKTKERMPMKKHRPRTIVASIKWAHELNQFDCACASNVASATCVLLHQTKDLQGPVPQ